MPFTNNDVALAIINFLESSVANKQVGEDYAELMEVAIDCIADAFAVDKSDAAAAIKSKFDGQSLVDYLNKAPVAGFAAGAATGATAQHEIDEGAKVQADALKAEGNKAMAQRNFNEAIEKYTQAIELDPSNVVYLSNRAAAYSSLGQHDKAISDAEKAIEIDNSFAKAYSRLGLAKYALNDAQGAMQAYKKGLEVEGNSPSEAMQKGFETAKKQVESELEKSIDTSSSTRDVPNAGAGAAPGGLPDFSSMFGGGGAGGMPSLSDMMSNPQVMQAAQEMMLNPQAMQNLMNNPMVKQMAQNFGLGGEGAPDLSNLMNNPMLSQFMGGAGAGAGANKKKDDE